jgi:restriction system protein
MLAVPLASPVQADAWRLAHVGADVDNLTGIDFEHCIGAMFVRLGYQVQFTETFDFGADLLVMEDGNRTAVQAKRQESPVGERAFQQVLAGRIHYQCDSAAVVTNSELMPRARRLAAECGVSIMERPHLTRMLEMAAMLESPRLLDPPLCSRCGIPLVKRSGRYGPFWGCANFPRGCHSRAELRKSLILSSPPSQAATAPIPGPRAIWEYKFAGSWELPAAAVAVHTALSPSVPESARPGSGGRIVPQQQQFLHGLALALVVFGWLCVAGFIVGLVEPSVGEKPQTAGWVFALVLVGVPTLWGTVRLRRARQALRH